jgi:hypothetical protein
MNGEYKRKNEKNFLRTFEEFRGVRQKTKKNGEKALPFRIAMDWHDLSIFAMIFQGNFRACPKVSVSWAFRGFSLVFHPVYRCIIMQIS